MLALLAPDAGLRAVAVSVSMEGMASPDQFFATGYPPKQSFGSASLSGVGTLQASGVVAHRGRLVVGWRARMVTAMRAVRPSAIPDRTLYRTAAWATIIAVPIGVLVAIVTR